MIDLNEHAQKAQEIAFNRWRKRIASRKTRGEQWRGQNE